MPQAYYFYLSIFVMKEYYLNSVTFGYVPLVTFNFKHFFNQCTICPIVTERRLKPKLLTAAMI